MMNDQTYQLSNVESTDEGLIVVDSQLMDRTDVRMIQSGGGTGFPVEAFECLLVPGELFGQKLEGHRPTQGGVSGLIDNTHTSTAEFLDDLVVGNGLADQCLSPP